jgi:hypothetical protein
MTREQLVDAVKCTTQTASCKDCTFPSDNDHSCFELLATEALAQMDSKERWKFVARKILRDFYDDNSYCRFCGQHRPQKHHPNCEINEAEKMYKYAMEQEDSK